MILKDSYKICYFCLKKIDLNLFVVFREGKKSKVLDARIKIL